MTVDPRERTYPGVISPVQDPTHRPEQRQRPGKTGLELLEADITRHVDDEEDEVFLEFRASVPYAELEAVGAKVAEAKANRTR